MRIELKVFSSKTCVPCKVLKNILKESSLTEDVFTRVDMNIYDLDNDWQEFEKNMIQSVPTLIIKDNDKILWSHSGSINKTDLLSILELYSK